LLKKRSALRAVWIPLLLQVKVPIARPLAEIAGIQGDVGLILGRDILLGEDGLGRADRHTSAAVNTGIWVNVKELAPLGVILLRRNDTIYRTNFDTVTLAGA
jgi:hypothetical protein